MQGRVSGSPPLIGDMYGGGGVMYVRVGVVIIWQMPASHRRASFGLARGSWFSQGSLAARPEVGQWRPAREEELG